MIDDEGVGFKISFILAGSQDVFGSVPSLEYSYLTGQPSQESVPVRVQMGTFTIPIGVVVSTWVVWGVDSRIVLKIFAQIGEAPVIPEAIRDIGVLSLLPTQVETR